MPVTKDWVSIGSSGTVISCVVYCSNFVDKLSKSSLDLVFSVCTTLLMSFTFVGCLKTLTVSFPRRCV